MSLAWFGFVTGLHLALLQFGYFFLLMIHVSSTYVTYISIVFAWMAGALIGLLWRRLDARLAVIGGVLAYYLIVAVVLQNPLSLHLLPLAAAGVFVSGLWGGRFFMVMLPFFRGVDRLFFHENNGFLVGVIGVFVGFTLLGRSFLLSAPLLSGALLMGQLLWLGMRPARTAAAVSSN